MPNRKEPRLEMEMPPKAKLAIQTEALEEVLEEGALENVEFNGQGNENNQPKPVKPSQKPTKARPQEEEAKQVAKNLTGKSSTGKAWLGILLALLALGLLAWQFMQFQQASLIISQQQQSMQLLGNRIQELEMRLLETGDDLSAAGSSFNEKLTWADSEIRKLWVVAHQRNRPAIEALESKNKQLEEGISQLEKLQVATLEANKLAVTASKTATEQSVSLAKDLKANNETLKTNVEKLNLQTKELAQRLTEVSLTASTLDERLRNQDLRNELAVLDKRLTELNTKTSKLQPQPEGLQATLAEQQEVLASLEASRGQLVGRVTRLMEEVRELQQRR